MAIAGGTHNATTAPPMINPNRLSCIRMIPANGPVNCRRPVPMAISSTIMPRLSSNSRTECWILRA